MKVLAFDLGASSGRAILGIYEEGKVTMEKISPEDMDFVCDGNCEGCPMLLLDCTGDVPRVLRAGALTLEDMKGCLS